jgi:hypothetical protein
MLCYLEVFRYQRNKICIESVILKVKLRVLFCVLESQAEAARPNPLELWQAGISH